MSKHGQDFNEKHTNFMNEIEMHKPRTDWHSTLVAIVIIVAAGFLVYAVASVINSLPTY